MTQATPTTPSLLAFALAASICSGCSGGGSGGEVASVRPSDEAGPSTTDPRDAGTSARAGEAGTDEDAGVKGVEIRNLTYTGEPGASLLTLNFVVANEGTVAIESIEGVEFAFPGSTGPTRYNVDFAAAGLDSKTCEYWTLDAGEESGVIELVLSEWSTGYYKLTIPCDSGRTANDLYGSTSSKQTPNGDVTLRLSGLLSDAEPWSATAAGPSRR